jgi:hypothetical protein
LFKNILLSLKEKVRARLYVMTLHAEEEMINDKLTIFDVEHCILTGEILERQRDQKTEEWKYLVRGVNLEEKPISSVVKIGNTGKVIFITVFANF